MPIKVGTDVGQNQLSEIQNTLSKYLGKDAVNKALNSAAKRAADSGKTELKRQITSLYTLPSAIVGKTLTTSGSSKFGNGDVGARIDISDRPNDLVKFTGVKPKKPNPKNPAPIKIEIKKGEVSTAKFFAVQVSDKDAKIFSRVRGKRMENPYKFLSRTNEDAKRWGRNPTKKGRQHIEKIFGPSVTGMFNYSKEIWPKVEEKINETLGQRLDHEIERLLNRK